MIICEQCNKELDEISFYRLRDGYRQPCKQCRAENAKIKYANITEKKCGRCGKIKSVSEFGYSRDYGYQSFCKDCKKIHYKQSPKYEPQQTGTKVCSCCGQEKDINEFSTNANSKDGRANHCRNCISKYDASRIFHIQTEGTKYCPRCKQELPITDFGIARGNPTGRCYSCKKCAIKFGNKIVNKRCKICGTEFKGRLEKDKYCPECKKKQDTHSEPEWEFIHILEKYNIRYKCEYNLEDKFWFDFYLPEYNLLIDINPTYSHAAIKTGYPAKRKYYHWDRKKLANKNKLKSICIWDWDDKRAIVKAIKENKLQIKQNQDVIKYWNINKTNNYKIDNGQDEKQMIAEGYLPIYDDGQTLIY